MRFTIHMMLLIVCAMNADHSRALENFNLTQVAPGVFVHHGQYVGLEDLARGDSANIGFVVGTKCVAVIDTGGSVATGMALRAAIKHHATVPICYVINTHGHFDHVLGNAAFLRDKPSFVGHANLTAVMAANRDYFPQNFAAELGSLGANGVLAPTREIASETTLDLGGRSLQLSPQPVAHSVADLTVLDVQTSTLWAGDLVFVERLPVVDGKISIWLKWIDDFSQRKFARVIPGHGPVSVKWPIAVQTERAYLQDLVASAKRAITDGVFLEDFVARKSSSIIGAWKVPDAHARNLNRAFREFEW